MKSKVKSFKHVTNALQFINEVSELFPKAKWQIDLDENIRVKRNTTKEDYPFCPVCFVTYKTTGLFCNNNEFEYAAKEIGLSKKVACTIVKNADNWTDNSKIRRAMVNKLVKKT